MRKTSISILIMAAIVSSAIAGDIQIKDDNLPHDTPRPQGGNNNGYWINGTVVKLGATNSNPVIVIRTGGGDYTYTIQSKNNNQILQLATQAIVSNLNVQAYAYDNYYNGWQSNGNNPYITTLYICANNSNPPPPSSSSDKPTENQ